MARTVTLKDIDVARARLASRGAIPADHSFSKSRSRPRDAEKLRSLEAITRARSGQASFYIDEEGHRVFDIGLV